MNLPDHQQILTALPTLNRQQLEGIRQRASLLLQHRTHKNESIEDEDWLLAGILTELKHRGLSNYQNFRIKKSSSFAGFQTQSETVRILLEQGAPGLNLVERRFLGEIAGYELANYIKGWTDVSLYTMLENVGKVPMAIDHAFPGYLASKMLWVVIRHKLAL